jgi:D-glycero-beta-D-manno-heptose 1-phosphate adenylyltransferase
VETGLIDKVVTLDTLVQLREEWRAAGRRVVFTNGAFDLLHVGHVRYLQAARALGDLLIVGLNDDASVRGYKGPTRPLVPAEERAELLAALACVDYVVLFSEPTATRLVAALEPDVYVKGGDYSASDAGNGGKPLPEAEAARAAGGEVVIVPFVPGRSTTGLIERIQRQARAEERGGINRGGRGEAAD